MLRSNLCLGAVGLQGCTDGQPIDQALPALQAGPCLGGLPMNLLRLGMTCHWQVMFDLLILLGSVLFSPPFLETVELAEAGVVVGLVCGGPRFYPIGHLGGSFQLSWSSSWQTRNRRPPVGAGGLRRSGMGFLAELLRMCRPDIGQRAAVQIGVEVVEDRQRPAAALQCPDLAAGN